MSSIADITDVVDNTSLHRKIGWRILPFLLVGYTFAYLDRINIGFAKLQMQTDLGLTAAIYGFAAGIFFIGYMMFEIPSNLLMAKIGARATLSRIMVLWGLASSSMFFVSGEMSLYVVRFLLGVFEAGFAPGMIFYLTLWYGPRHMAKVIAIVMLAGPVGGIFGAPLSTWIMTAFDGVGGHGGWQWMFMLEGIPPIILGVLGWFILSDTPAQASWLTDAEKRQLETERGSTVGEHHSFRTALTDYRVYLLSLAYFTVISGLYTVSFWLPTILQANGLTDTMQIGLYSTLPYIAAVVAMIWLGRRSDKKGERKMHSAIPMAIGAVALSITALTGDQFSVSLVAIIIATAMLWGGYTVFWSIPPLFLKGPAAAGGIALINTIGLFGGFFSPILIGWVQTSTGSLQNGLLTISAIVMAGAVTLLVMRVPSAR